MPTVMERLPVMQMGSQPRENAAVNRAEVSGSAEVTIADVQAEAQDITGNQGTIGGTREILASW